MNNQKRHIGANTLTFGKFRSLFKENGILGNHGLMALVAASHPVILSCLAAANKEDVVRLVNLNIEGTECFLVTRGELPLRSLSDFSPSVLNEWHTKRYPAVITLYDLKTALGNQLVRNHNPFFSTRPLFEAGAYSVVSKAMTDMLNVMEDELSGFLSVKTEVEGMTAEDATRSLLPLEF